MMAMQGNEKVAAEGTAVGFLDRLFTDLAHGSFPDPDGLIEVVPAPTRVAGAVLAFTAHHIVAADVEESWVLSFCPPGDFLAPVGPRFIGALTERLNSQPGPLDLQLCAKGLEGEPDIALVRAAIDASHPRVSRARRMRRDVRVYETVGGEGLVTVGRGLADRWEAGFEVAPQRRNRGLGRALVAAARRLVEPEEPLYMQVAAGNVASLRAVLSQGFIPVGAEILFPPVR